MSEQTVIERIGERIRKRQAQVVADEIESFVADHDMAKRMRDLEDLIQACLHELDNDNGFIRSLLDRSRLLNPEGLDRLNRFIQEYCDEALARLNKLRDVLAAEGQGCAVDKASLLAKAEEAYRRWKEDVPELLLMNHPPVKEQLRQRIEAAINSPVQQSDWRELFLEDEP
jgi:hypothetical protein